MDNISVYSDGGCIGKNARDGLTYGSFKVFKSGADLYHSERIQHGVGSNNVAEYKTLICALEYCLQNGLKRPTVYIDSMLVYRQCKDDLSKERWKVKDERLKPLREEVMWYIKGIGARLEWVNREKIVFVLGH